MAAWRRIALELFPEADEFTIDDWFSSYALFFWLLPFSRAAHQRDDEDALRRSYGFAQWCWHQRRGSELRNAVAVSFYEHLFDHWKLHEQVVPWLELGVRSSIWTLWEDRLDQDKRKELRRLFDREDGPEKWRQLRAVVPHARD